MRPFASGAWPILAVLCTFPAALTAQTVCGDCDERGNGVDILDALEAAQIAVALFAPSGTQPCTCDVDGSGSITIIDALFLAQLGAGLGAPISCGAACAGPCPGTVTLRGPSAPVQCGTTTTVFIDADLGSCDVGAYQFRLIWDPTVLELDSTHGVDGVLETPQGAPSVVNPGIAGEVTFNAIFNCLAFFSTSLANVRFNVIGTPSSSTLVTLEVDDLVRCDTTTIGMANPRVADAISVDVSAQACLMACTASGSVTLSAPATVDCNGLVLVDLDADLGTCDLGAYQFRIDWNASLFSLDTTFGTMGVLETPVGSPMVVNSTIPGSVIFNGIFFGCPTLGATQLAQIRLRALGAQGTSSAITVQVLDLVRCDTSPIGPPSPRAGSGTSITINGPSCAPPPPTVISVACGNLRSGVFATGLQVEDVADDATTDYYVLTSIPAGTQQITFATTGTGDMDLYVGAPGVPGGSQTVGNYPHRSLGASASESINLSVLSSPALATYGAGPVAIAVHGYTAGNYNLTITCSTMPVVPPATVLACGTEATGTLTADGSGNLSTASANAYFRIDTTSLPAGLTELVILTGGLAGDIDLYVGNPGTAPGSTVAGGYIQLTGPSSHHSYVMPASQVATYGSAPIAVTVHADRAGDYRVLAVCLTSSSAYRYVRYYVYTVGSGLSASIENTNPTGRDRFNAILAEWSRLYRAAPSPEFHAAFEVRPWTGSGAEPYRNLNFDTESDDLDSYTATFPTNPNRPPGPHTFFVETLTAGGFATLGISWLDRTGAPGSFGAANAVGLERTSFATTSCAEYTYVLGIAAAHECGHYMSLEHTTQFVGACGGAVDYYDSYGDTPQCSPGTSCSSCPDYGYMMYPIIFDLGCPLSVSQRQDDISAQQEGAMEANPCTR